MDPDTTRRLEGNHLKPPSEFGTDAVVGWMQWFGAHIDTGGPAAVYLATSLKQMRRMPGRLTGESLDRLGIPVFRLNLQTQEQHIRDINKLLNDCDELIPKWLNFVKDVVDSEDLPLNVYRETLQQNKILRVIKKNHVTKCMDMFDEIAELNDDRKKFYEQCVKCMKPWIREDFVDDFEIAELLRFFTSKPGDEQISFKEYVDCMKEGQNDNYHITGESIAVVSPKKGHKVLYMADPVDQYAVHQLKEFDGTKPFLQQHIFNFTHSETEMMRYMTMLQHTDLSLTTSMISLGLCIMKLISVASLAPCSWPEVMNIHPFAHASNTISYREMLNFLEVYLVSCTGSDACSLPALQLSTRAYW